MTDPAVQSALARIERALVRLETLSRRPPAAAAADPRYQALRARTQAALAGLETVIAQVGKDGKR